MRSQSARVSSDAPKAMGPLNVTAPWPLSGYQARPQPTGASPPISFSESAGAASTSRFTAISWGTAGV